VRGAIFFRSFDFYLGLAIFIVATSGAVLAFAKIDQHQARVRLVDQTFELGVRKLGIFGPNGCVGTFQIDLSKPDGQLSLLLSGLLRTSTHGRVSSVKLDADFAFNLVGQLGAAVVKLTVDEKLVMLGLEDINPIRVSIVAPSLGLGRRQEFRIPGPIEISPVGARSYQFRYSPLGARETPIGLVLRQYADVIGVRVEDSAELVAACTPENETALALDEFAEKIRDQAQGLIGLLPRLATGL
jgi:hypothetical protein